jgi:hypothetical protein
MIHMSSSVKQSGSRIEEDVEGMHGQVREARRSS